MKDELLNLQCQLSHELKEWHESGTDHYGEASALLYKSQRAAVGLYADIYSQTADCFETIITNAEAIHEKTDTVPNEVNAILESTISIMHTLTERTASSDDRRTVTD